MAKARARAKATSKRTPRVRVSGCGLTIGDAREPLYSGAIHYWRLSPEAWRPALGALRGLGLRIAETYVPWDVHEVAPGEHDFGERDPRKDVGAFLDAAAEEGLWCFVRPGPHINAEMTGFGIPDRVLHDKACQARSPRQNPVVLAFPPQMFPVPSYASSNYHALVGKWYDAVAEIIAPRLYPDGPVVLLQVDNEAAYYFRNGPYCQDYHPDAIALWRRFLEERHGGLEQTARAHRRRYATWEEAAAPTRFDATTKEELPLHLDWAAFQEHLVTHALSRMKRRMSRAGLKGLPVCHNLPLGEGGLPMSLPAIERAVGLVGLDYYHAAREHRTIKRRTLYLAGTVEVPWAPELGVGAPPWFTPLSHEDSMFVALCALAYGLRGFNLYMAVDRDRWFGAPIDTQGAPRLEARAWRTLVERLRELSFHDLRRDVEVALVVPREYGRLSRATHLFGPVSPSTLEAIGGTPVDMCREDPLGFEGPIQVTWWRMLAKISDALTSAGVPYVYVDSDAPAERFAGARVVVAPTYELVAEPRWRALEALAAAGKTVVYGPTVPNLDVAMQPLSLSEIHGGRRVLIDTPDDAARLVAELVAELSLARPYAARPAPVETTVHRDDSGDRALFVVHPGSAPVTATIDLPRPLSAIDVMTGQEIAGEHTLEVRMPPRTCRMFALTGREAT